jgi:predicted lipid-binding transport protein (Tim44 family)
MRESLIAVREPLRVHHLQLARGGGGGHGGGGGGGGGGHGGFGGGGHSYGGHYYGGGGSGGSIGGFFVILFFLFFLAVLLFIVIAIFRATRRVAAATDSENPSKYEGLPPEFAEMLARRGQDETPATPQSNGVSEAVAALRNDDPDFEAETFLQRAEMTYFLVNRAYQHRDAPALQPYLAPDLYAQRAQGVQTLLAEHHKPAQIDLNVRGMHVPSVAHGPDGDRIVVHFDLVSRERMLDDRTGKLVSDAGNDQRSGENWTFSRKAGAKTVVSGGVVAAKCPNCGAPLALDETGHCKHCNASVTTGDRDWIVASIEPSSFEGATADGFLGSQRLSAQAGFQAITAADPAVASDAFLKRVASAFDALQTAWQARDLDAARGFMSPGLYYGWSAQVDQLKEQHRKNVLEGLRIDGISPVGVVHGNVFDDVMVRIDATCADYEIDETTGRIAFGDKRPESFTEYWTFQRGVGVATTGKAGTLEKQCPNCGAPLNVNAVGECTYCKAAVTSGKFDWVLSRIEQPEDVAL